MVTPFAKIPLVERCSVGKRPRLNSWHSSLLKKGGRGGRFRFCAHTHKQRAQYAKCSPCIISKLGNAIIPWTTIPPWRDHTSNTEDREYLADSGNSWTMRVGMGWSGGKEGVVGWRRERMREDGRRSRRGYMGAEEKDVVTRSSLTGTIPKTALAMPWRRARRLGRT